MKRLTWILVAALSGGALADEAKPRKAFDRPVGENRLDANRGRALVQANDQRLNAAVGGNVAADLMTGSNTISEGAFSNANGLPMVIQNTGNNVLIQNATVLNVTVK